MTSILNSQSFPGCLAMHWAMKEGHPQSRWFIARGAARRKFNWIEGTPETALLGVSNVKANTSSLKPLNKVYWLVKMILRGRS